MQLFEHNAEEITLNKIDNFVLKSIQSVIKILPTFNTT